MNQENNTDTQPAAEIGQEAGRGSPSTDYSPSFDPKADNQCALGRRKDGTLEILSAPPVFVCARESIEDLITRHNDLLRERDEARRMWSIHQDKLAELNEQVRLTIAENLHLADGDTCTLKRLKDAIGFDMDSLENAEESHAGKEPG